MANKKSTHPIPTPWAAGRERQPFSMAFSPTSTSFMSANINVDREPVKVVAFGLRENEYIEVLQLVGELSGDNFEAYKPFDGELTLTQDQNEIVLHKSGRYRLRFVGSHGFMHCFWWQFSMTHEWANEVLSNGLRRLCECLRPPPFEIVAGRGIEVRQLNDITWHIANTFAIDVADTTTIDHTVTEIAGIRILSSDVLVSPYEGNLIQVRPDGLYVNLSSLLDPCNFGSTIQPSPDRFPLRLLALNEFNCIVSIPASDIARYLCNVDCTPTVNLTVNKVATPSSIVYGQISSFTVTISNAGPEDAVDALVRDNLAGNYSTSEPILISYTGGAFGPASVTSTQLVAGFYCGIPAGGQVTFSYQVYPWEPGTYTNTTFVDLLPLYINEGQSFDSATLHVSVDTEDLSIEIVEQSYTFVSGVDSWVDVIARNNGVSVANEVTICMPIPRPEFQEFPFGEGMYIIGKSWEEGPDIVLTEAEFNDCYTVENVPPGGFIFVRMWFTPIEPGLFSHIFTVSGISEPNIGNNTVLFEGEILPSGPPP